jgi:hypothetical protein
MNPFDEYAQQLIRWLVWVLLGLLVAILLTVLSLSQ